MNQFTGAFVSKICNAVLEYWSVILQQESLVNTQNPAPLDTIAAYRPPSSSGDVDAERNTQDPSTDSWKMTRFLLNQERDQLYLWRNTFSQDDLDRIMSNKSNVVGSAVLGSLVGIGKALLDQSGSSQPNRIPNFWLLESMHMIDSHTLVPFVALYHIFVSSN